MAEYANIWLVSIVGDADVPWRMVASCAECRVHMDPWLDLVNEDFLHGDPVHLDSLHLPSSFRYDQIMRLGWKVFIPVTLVWLVVVGAWMQTPWNIWN